MKKEIKTTPQDREAINLIRDSLYNYKNKFLHTEDNCIYFELDGILYGFSHIKVDVGYNLYAVWFEDCDFDIVWDDKKEQNILLKSYPEDCLLLDNEELLELYTLLNMEIKLQSERK